MANKYDYLTQEDFVLVQNNQKIHDKAFETKPTTFFKDAIRRFCKNKSSIVAFVIIGLLILIAIFLPSISNKNISYVSTKEAFLAPKLFEAGTGFWDGTRKYTNVVYDEANEAPAEFYKPGVLNLKVLGESFINTTAKYGSGGYAVMINETASPVYFYSYPTKFTADGNYIATIKLYDYAANHEGVTYNGNEQAAYSVNLMYRTLKVDEKGNPVKDNFGKEIYENIVIPVKDFTNDYSECSINISNVLAEKGLTEIEECSLYIELSAPKENARSYVMVENIEITANEDVENFESLKTISMLEPNKTLQLELTDNKEKPLGYWTSTAIKNMYNVRVVLCNFTYDTYAKPYDNIEETWAPSDLQTLKKKGYCDFDDKNIKETFVVLDEEKCPIDGIISVEYTTTRPIKANKVVCSVKQYLSYTHGGKESTYTKAPKFLFGTDNNGYDVLKKSFAGLRTSLILGVCVATVCFAFGLVWGSFSGYFGGTLDLLMERFMDILGGVPTTIVLTIAILKLGNNLTTFFMALCMTGWMGTASRTRTQFYRFKGREYVLASRTLGAKDIRLIFKHILPNSMGTIITGSVFMINGVISSEATIAYLNLGLQGTNSFGVMMSENQQYLQSYSYLVLEPAIIISLLMISFNLFGNGLRDAFNPSLKGTE